ncbi:MAG: metallophosphoesterase family protein [Flavobacteriales bacterium]|nr:metallophosphoesterase family protein [Flavobacteriales bacterium]
MKKILLLSDTHGYMDKTILKYCAECDEIWHAGDWGVGVNEALENTGKLIRGVYGNIDGTDIRTIYPEVSRFSCEGLMVLMKHIGGYPKKYSFGVKQQITENKTDIFISGHSHILKIMRDIELNNLLHLNPGAAGKHGFHLMRTMLNFKLDSGRVFDMNVIELGKRAEI